MKRNIVKMSLVAAMLLSTGAYAGKIVTDADNIYNADIVADTQWGFGGLNFGNLVVNITSDSNFSDIISGGDDIFPLPVMTDGSYPAVMDNTTSFETVIFEQGGTEVMGRLHGKDWPVGEPAGIKIINDDTKVKSNGKPINCIMTTSYLGDSNTSDGDDTTYYLDDIDTAKPTVCSSYFQSHKRFKINMQAASVVGPDTVTALNTVTGGLGEPIDLVFNLDTSDTNTSARKYQVFQKINNYTGVRLDGFTIEVLDENNTHTNSDNISLSLGLTDNDGGEIWPADERANYSRGLWGPKDTKVYVPPRFEFDGFFDDKRAGFTVVETNSSTLTGGPTTLNSSYVDLFGLWLPSEWAPKGIFYDEDGNPETDNELVAFWGDPDGDGTNAWHAGGAPYTFPEVTAQVLADWANDPDQAYDIATIEDTLNLGLNYMVVVADNAKIGETFTIRITPRVAVDQTPPSYIDENGSYILPPDLNGTVPPVTPPSSGGGGGGCTYNPNSKNFDMTFLMLMALGMLYPFRRRFLK